MSEFFKKINIDWLILNLLVASSFAGWGYRIGGWPLAIPFGIAGFYVPTSLLLLIAVVYDSIVRPLSARCESNQCVIGELFNHYIFIRIGIHEGYGIMYTKCKCGHEYLEYGIKFLAKIKEDGTLEPLYKRTKWRGWQKDDGTDSLALQFKIAPKLLEELRQCDKGCEKTFSDGLEKI